MCLYYIGSFSGTHEGLTYLTNSTAALSIAISSNTATTSAGAATPYVLGLVKDANGLPRNVISNLVL